jgi:hypothetical protein
VIRSGTNCRCIILTAKRDAHAGWQTDLNVQNLNIYQENRMLSLLIQFLNSLTLDLTHFVVRPWTNCRCIIFTAKRDVYAG